jgi:hypothetical protein
MQIQLPVVVLQTSVPSDEVINVAFTEWSTRASPILANMDVPDRESVCKLVTATLKMMLANTVTPICGVSEIRASLHTPVVKIKIIVQLSQNAANTTTCSMNKGCFIEASA